MKKNIVKQFLLVIALIPILVLLVALGYGDIMQYKRIGDTNFYLVETMAMSSNGKPLPGLYYSQNTSEEGFCGINLGAVPSQILWNCRYIVVKCIDRDNKKLISYCIIKILKTSSFDPADNYELHEYTKKDEYEKAMRNFGLKESEMNHTDNIIPWSLHLWE